MAPGSSEAGPCKITLFSHKGGVGKTTLTVNTAWALADAGYSVLVVDADPQCSLTSYLKDEATVDEYLDSSIHRPGPLFGAR